MWRKPPKTIAEAIRSLIVIGALLAGLLSLKLVTFGLPLSERMVGMGVSMVPLIALVGLVLLNPRTRAERRYAQAMAKELSESRAFTVNLVLLKKEIAYGHDMGVLTIEGGCLHFHGLSTSFSIPRSQVRLRAKAEGDTADKITLLVPVGEEPIGIDFTEDGTKASDPTLANSFDRFWKSASTGELVPPPSSPQPRPWPGRFFPGWKQVAFWASINLFVIVQAQILNNQGLHSAQRLLAAAFTGTILLALVAEGVRFARLMREVEEDLPKATPLILPAQFSAPIPTDDPAEVHVRA